jgi:hypothetical protein
VARSGLYYRPGEEREENLELELDPSPNYKVMPTEYPQAEILYLPAIQETVPVYQGKFRVTQDVTMVLSFQTGYTRDYNRDPYRDLPMNRQQAAAVFVGDAVKLYPLSELTKAEGPVEDVVRGKRLRLDYDRQKRRLIIQDDDAQAVEHFVAFLADLRAFYPMAERFQLQRGR